MVSSLEGLEAFLRVLGLRYTRRGGSLLVEYEHPSLGRVGIVVELDQASSTVRLAAPTDVEPFQEALGWFLEENFSSQSYKYAMDLEGFIVVVYDLPASCVESARVLREALIEVVKGYERLMERVEEG